MVVSGLILVKSSWGEECHAGAVAEIDLQDMANDGNSRSAGFRRIEFREFNVDLLPQSADVNVRGDDKRPVHADRNNARGFVAPFDRDRYGIAVIVP